MYQAREESGDFELQSKEGDDEEVISEKVHRQILEINSKYFKLFFSSGKLFWMINNFSLTNVTACTFKLGPLLNVELFIIKGKLDGYFTSKNKC